MRPDPAAVAAAAALLASSKRPIVLAGRGAIGCASAVEHLADSLGALLSTTLQAKGLFDGNPFDIGLAGGYSSDVASALFGEADCVIAIGASLNGWTTKGRSLFPNAKLIVVDADPHVLGTGRRAASALVILAVGLVLTAKAIPGVV